MKNSNREKKLLKNTLIISIGQICTKLVTFLLLPLYTGILTTAEYGTVDLLHTLVSLLLPIITFQVEQAVFRELIEARENDERKKKIILIGITSVTLQCLAFLALFLIASPFIHNHYKYFLMVNVLTTIYNSLMLQIARGLGNNTKYAIGGFISAISTILFNILFLVVIKWGVNGMLLGTMLGQIISCIFMMISLKIYKYFSLKYYSKKTVKSLWKYSLPLIPNAISWWIFNTSDRVIVSILLGLSFTGLLSAANKFSSLIITFFNIFYMSWNESISLHIKDKDINEYFNKMFQIILNLFTSLSLGVIACMPFIYPIMVNKKFSVGYGLVPILILATLFNVIVGLLSVLYIANKNTKEIANTSIIAAIINIISHLALIKFVGLYAAAISTLLAYFAMAIYRLIDVRKKYFKVEINKQDTIIASFIAIILFITYYINNLYLNIISLIVAVIFTWYCNKNSISIILRMVKKKIMK